MSYSNDPNSAVSLDFPSALHARVRQRLIELGKTEGEDATFMEQSRKYFIEEGQTSGKQRVNAELEAAEIDRPKFLPINQNLGVPDQPPCIPSAAVMATLRRGDYVPLYYFTHEALYAIDDSTKLGLIHDDKSSLLPHTLRNVKADSDLDSMEFIESTRNMLEVLPYAGWPEDRIEMFRAFWRNIRDHKLWSQPVFQKILLMYQCEQRRRWHMLCASTSNPALIYNLATINEEALLETGRWMTDVDSRKRTSMARQASQRDNTNRQEQNQKRRRR